MLSLSNISPKQGESYYSRENYYSPEATQAHSQWAGIGATTLGLEGQIDCEQFSNLLQGKAPDGTQLPGRQIKRKHHRAGLDLTFSAPKSISIAALVGGDRRLEEAHQIAVNRTLAHIEGHHAQARIWDGRRQQATPTGNLLVAQFHHDTSRELDPQLHTHCVAINATQLPDGTWKALSNESIYRNAKLLGSIYKNELAYEVRQLGYEIETDLDCLFELKGYGPEQLEHFSKRRQQIVAAVGEGANAKEREWATIRTRAAKGKDIPRELLHQRWMEQVELAGIQLRHPEPTVAGRSTATDIEGAREAVDRAVEHCAERSAAFRRTSIQQFVLDRIQPFNLAAIEAAIGEHPDLMPTVDRRFTTETALEREQATLRLMQAGRERLPVIALDGDELNDYLENETLTEGQRSAIHLVATTSDRFIAWQGVAGAGKTAALRYVKQLAEDAGYRLEGYAPSASAAKVLGDELEIDTATVASLLLSPSKQPDRPQLWVVDEASLLSAKDALALLNRATQADARVILVGDLRQLSAVEAGNPFRSLQQAGMQTAHLEESLRQRTPDLKAAVDAVARGEVKAGLERLERFNRVFEIEEDGARRQQLVSDYLSLSPEERAQTLLLAGTNAERQAIAGEVRRALQREGELDGEEVALTRLKSKDLTDIQSRFAHHYQEGDAIVPLRHYPRRGLLRTERYTVAAIVGDRLQLEGTDGSRHDVDPMSFRKRVYIKEAIQIAAGDRLRRTRNDKEAGHRNGQACQVLQIDEPSKTATLEYGDGRTETIDLTQAHHLDYNWVNTIHSSQGKTAKRALVMADRAVGQESFYVAVSRVKDELKIYTSNRDRLLERAQTSQSQENPSDVLRPSPTLTSDERSPVSARRPSRRAAEPVAEFQQLEFGLDLLSPEGKAHRDSDAATAERRREDDSQSAGQNRTDSGDRLHPAERPQSSTARTAQSPEPASGDAADREHSQRRRGRFAGLRDLARDIAASTAAAGEASPSAATAGESVAGDDSGIEPGQIGFARSAQPSIESDFERTRIEFEEHPHRPAAFHPAGGGIGGNPAVEDDPSHAESAGDLSENQRQGEQPGTEPAQDPGAVELEERSRLARMEQLSDDELSQLASEFARNRDRLQAIRANRPFPEEKVRLQSQLQDLEVQFEQLSDRLQEQRAALETLGPRRSFWYPFGSPAQEVDIAEARVQSTLQAMRGLKQQWTEVQQQIERWEKREQVYQARIAPSIHLLQAERDLALAPVQARLTRIRAERQRQREIRRVTGQLDRWKEIAAVLGKSEAYLARIEAVKAEVRQGQPLSEAAIRTSHRDRAAYRAKVMSEPEILREIERVAGSLGYLVETYGQAQPKGSRLYDGENWRIEQRGNVLELRNRRDGSVTLKVEGRDIIDYQPTREERQELLELSRAVTCERQVQDRPQRGWGLYR